MNFIILDDQPKQTCITTDQEVDETKPLIDKPSVKINAGNQMPSVWLITKYFEAILFNNYLELVGWGEMI